MDPRHLQHLVVQHLTRVPAVWLFGCLASCLAGWLAPGWLPGCLAIWLVGSLAGWLVGWLAFGIVNISFVFLAYLNMCTQNCCKTIGFYSYSGSIGAKELKNH